jgi:hypothetical protein
MTDYPTSVTALVATERAAVVALIRSKAKSHMADVTRLPASKRFEREAHIKELQELAATIEAGEHRK